MAHGALAVQHSVIFRFDSGRAPTRKLVHLATRRKCQGVSAGSANRIFKLRHYPGAARTRNGFRVPVQAS